MSFGQKNVKYISVPVKLHGMNIWNGTVWLLDDVFSENQARMFWSGRLRSQQTSLRKSTSLRNRREILLGYMEAPLVGICKEGWNHRCAGELQLTPTRNCNPSIELYLSIYGIIDKCCFRQDWGWRLMHLELFIVIVPEGFQAGKQHHLRKIELCHGLEERPHASLLALNLGWYLAASKH